MSNYFTDRGTFTERIERTLAEYGLKVRGCHINSPGKFEGCGAWVPHFYEAALEGSADDDLLDANGDQIGWIFWYDQETHDTLGNLAPEGWVPHTESSPGSGKRGAAVVWEDDSGFVHGTVRILKCVDGMWTNA